MNWLFLTFLAVFSRATYSIASKLLTSKVQVSPITQSVLLGTFAGLLAIPIGLLIGGISFEGIDMVWQITLVMILSQAFGNILFFKGLKSLDAGTSQIAFSSILIWSALLSPWLLGSQFSIQQVLGMFLMLIAIILVQYRNGIKVEKPVLLIIGSAALFAIFQITSAQMDNVVNTGAYLILAYLGSAFILTLIYLKTLSKDFKLLISQVKNTSLSTLFAAGTSLLYFIFSYFAYQVAPDRGIVVVLLTSQVVLSVLLGIVFLKERDNMGKKILAGALAFIASVLIRA